MKRFLIAGGVSALCLMSLTSCYEDYVKDYDYSGVYLAYQYDLRSFVVGEGMQFKIGAVLGGVIENNKDRDIWYVFNDNLVTEDLRMYVPGSETPFNAFSEMTGATNVGAVSQDYVKSAMTASGISALTPIPSDAISTPSGRFISIARGSHTGTAVIKADSTAFLSLPGAGPKPYYAFGIQITSADADTVLLSKSYEVIALRYENLLFGTWYHNGKTQICDAAGTLLDTKVYHSEANTDDLCNLTTVAPDAVEADKTGYLAGKLRIAVDGGVLNLSAAPDGPAIEDLGSSFNNVRLLQDRKLYLNYKFTDASGNVNVVNDTLSFRNRIRDGVNEWQDENPEHYNK
ncbi:MAG: hypothetical protein SOZ66_05500 [Candidatus Cryptobacteroides sp.]|nr:hypothetical protein [Candidatus Cryptobacteroides sp.]